jgi:hypothetical protein
MVTTMNNDKILTRSYEGQLLACLLVLLILLGGLEVLTVVLRCHSVSQHHVLIRLITLLYLEQKRHVGSLLDELVDLQS